MHKALPIMVQGTHSDAGKSVIATALCRIFYQDGFSTAPFKSQNMALNSYITPDGKEIGRAQGVQAEAAGIDPTTDMNPILIKPTRESEAQIVVHGKPYKNMKASSYRKEFFPIGLELIESAYERLSQQYERIVIEGAGSPAEINLNDREMVNMRVANLANAPVIIVADIEKGGVFASLVGTLQLLHEKDRDRIIGVIINKFRGDVKLLEPGLKWFEEYTGKKVIGVIPYVKGLNIDAEDSVVLSNYTSKVSHYHEIDIAVIRYPMISNFTDVDPFFEEVDCDVRFVTQAKDLGSPDLIILPGSKNTIEDLTFLHQTGLAEAIKKRINTNDTHLVGICGGYQMLGKKICDPYQVESKLHEIEGLTFLDSKTTMRKEKTTVRSRGSLTFEGRIFDIEGYEIHMGTTFHSNQSLIKLKDRSDGVILESGRIFGTYFHGIFHNDTFRHHYLDTIRTKKGLSPISGRVLYKELRQQAYDILADHVRRSIDLPFIEAQMKEFQKQTEKGGFR